MRRKTSRENAPKIPGPIALRAELGYSKSSQNTKKFSKDFKKFRNGYITDDGRPGAEILEWKSDYGQAALSDMASCFLEKKGIKYWPDRYPREPEKIKTLVMQLIFKANETARRGARYNQKIHNRFQRVEEVLEGESTTRDAEDTESHIGPGLASLPDEQNSIPLPHLPSPSPDPISFLEEPSPNILKPGRGRGRPKTSGARVSKATKNRTQRYQGRARQNLRRTPRDTSTNKKALTPLRNNMAPKRTSARLQRVEVTIPCSSRGQTDTQVPNAAITESTLPDQTIQSLTSLISAERDEGSVTIVENGPEDTGSSSAVEISARFLIIGPRANVALEKWTPSGELSEMTFEKLIQKLPIADPQDLSGLMFRIEGTIQPTIEHLVSRDGSEEVEFLVVKWILRRLIQTLEKNRQEGCEHSLLFIEIEPLYNPQVKGSRRHLTSSTRRHDAIESKEA